MNTTPDLTTLSNAELMAAIRREREYLRDTLATKGPRTGPEFAEARIYPSLVALEAERNRRMAERRAR